MFHILRDIFLSRINSRISYKLLPVSTPRLHLPLSAESRRCFPELDVLQQDCFYINPFQRSMLHGQQWDCNTSQREMLRIPTEEGFVKEQELFWFTSPCRLFWT
jgi:hypothetical protein